MTLIIHPQSDQEADFLKEMLQRMGIAYQEPEETEEIPENNLPYTPTKGITHPQTPKLSEQSLRRTASDLPNLPEVSNPYTDHTDEVLDRLGGILENEGETLDELLNQLTP